MNLELSLQRVRENKWIGILSIVLAVCVLWTAAYLLSVNREFGVDWHIVFRPAALELASGRSPYGLNIPDNVMRFYNAPWTLLPLLPIALLPPAVGQATMVTLIIVSLVYVAYRFDASPTAILAFMLSIPVLLTLDNLNLEFMVLLGLILPPQIGLFFLVVKPQMSIGYIVYLAYKQWKEGGIRQAAKVFWPVSVATLLSFIPFGFWPRWMLVANEVHDSNIWPVGLVIGFSFLYLAITNEDERKAITSSPFLSPYVSPMSWMISLIEAMKNEKLMIVLSISTWIAHLLPNLLF